MLLLRILWKMWFLRFTTNLWTTRSKYNKEKVLLHRPRFILFVSQRWLDECFSLSWQSVKINLGIRQQLRQHQNPSFS